MKILLMPKSLGGKGVGGIETFTINFANKLADMGHQVIIAAEGGILEKKLDRKVEFYNVNYNLFNFIQFYKSIYLIKKIIKERKVDVVHSFSANSSIVGYIAAKFFRKPKVVIIGTPMGLKNSPNEFSLKTFLKNICFVLFSDKLLAISGEIKKALIKAGANPNKITDFNIIGLDLLKYNISEHNGNTFRKEINVGKDVPIITTIGMLHPRKSHELFIKAANIVSKTVSPIKFVIVGDGPLRNELEILSEELNIKDKIIITGIRLDLQNILSATNIYVRPGILEGFCGISLLEAMAMYKASICFDTHDTREVIINNINGIIVPNGDVNKLAEAIIYLLKNKDKAKEIGVEARRTIEKRYDFDNIFNELLNYYKKFSN